MVPFFPSADSSFCIELIGKKQYYDWDRYYQTVRSLQPMACISVCGPDVRWCGNEAGDTRDAEWSVVPKRTADTEKVASASQHEDQAEFRQRKISAKDRDLGSREMLKDEHDLIWYPAEVMSQKTVRCALLLNSFLFMSTVSVAMRLSC